MDETPTVPVDAIIQRAAQLTGENEKLISDVLDGVCFVIADFLNAHKTGKIFLQNFGTISKGINNFYWFHANNEIKLALNSHYYEKSFTRKRGFHLKVRKDWRELDAKS